MRAIALFAALCLGGCLDSVFEVCGQVTSCADDTPLVGAEATLTLTDGVSDAEQAVAYASPTGDFCVSLNEPPDSSARLVVDKPGYLAVAEVFDGAPDGKQELCLQPAEP